MSANTDAFENKLIDFLFRGQALGLANSSAAAGSGPTNLYVALFTAAGSDAAAGTEVSGGGYARVAVASSLANWAGTQGAGTTTASNGSSGTTSNNNAITFPTPSAAWGQVTEWGIFDSLTGGTELIRAPLGTAKTINNGDPAPSFAAGALTYQVDN
jgi:hypothetical protein